METKTPTEQQQIIELLTKQERHLKLIVNVLSVYIILQLAVIGYFLSNYLWSQF